MRLDKMLSLAGIGSRAEVKELIRKGEVKISDKVAKDPGADVNFGENILVSGRDICLSEFEYWILYKPAGVLSACSDPKKPVVMSLIPTKRVDLSPVGRLDEDTEGLLLITNDGALAHRLIGPKNHVKKKYYAELNAPLPDNAKDLLESPMDLGDFVTKPAEYERIGERAAFLTLTEGKFHQVKRMFEKTGCEVTYLRRESFGPLTLNGLSTGEARRLTDREADILKRE